MIKRVGIFALPEGADGEKFWEYHKQEHAAHVANLAGPALKKYVINRVKEVKFQTDNAFGKQRYFGLTELWWESEEAMNKVYDAMRTTKLPNGKTVIEDFWSQVPEGFGAIVEEFTVKDIT